MSALSEYVSSLSVDKGMSLRQLADLVGISVEAARRLTKGHGGTSDATLERVAARLPGADLMKLRKLAGLSIERPFEVPREFDQLTPGERRVVIAVGRQILASSGRLDPPADQENTDDSQGVTHV
ncbi:hypothetical protein BBK82_03730 [Lentzea guizhouensis]|uniref:HTH cro/C1-type domain-containing protein n=1 Tax=Lentzea guizhouensis TaxID=1586287 RepID=A0A1B2HC72_9PSEU|nr:helix-turn-helix transcriptional regulator [Lentzea guizhouensis]ANZ35327.1 hypothetical protein BBK82_03730 [Lentzea guizhouensis]